MRTSPNGPHRSPSKNPLQVAVRKILRFVHYAGWWPTGCLPSRRVPHPLVWTAVSTHLEKCPGMLKNESCHRITNRFCACWGEDVTSLPLSVRELSMQLGRTFASRLDSWWHSAEADDTESPVAVGLVAARTLHKKGLQRPRADGCRWHALHLLHVQDRPGVLSPTG
eukprot:TRINITY_DN21814_c0_g1_i4.p1 TRINITY_DN21814_c0_g1~~TRINITY_DN21814_c0_g1_i4.p1  ORF type:complete len:167 (-),score=9.16 TRINITY_DN21814_c0_g1_i4:321-821(-)